MLALIAGRGELPGAVARAQDQMPLVCNLADNDPSGLAVDITFRIEHLGSFMETLRARGVTQVCLCGAVERPAIDPTKIDPDTAPFVPVLAQAVAQGEDSALRAVLELFEAQGFAVMGAHELAPGLLPTDGVPTQAQPAQDVQDLCPVAARVLSEQAAADQGQACVIRNGRVIAREDSRGTDAMLNDLTTPGPASDPPPSSDGDPLGYAFDIVGDTLGAAADWLSGPDAPSSPRGTGGVLFKAPKPGQDRRVDLPTIGPDTARNAARAGLRGIVIEAGGVMVLDQPRVLEILNAGGMFLWVR